jgi:hypothetical protein
MGGAHQTRSPRSAFGDIQDALQATGQSIRPRGSDAFMASCPLHTDHSPSLSVTWRMLRARPIPRWKSSKRRAPLNAWRRITHTQRSPTMPAERAIAQFS